LPKISSFTGRYALNFQLRFKVFAIFSYFQGVRFEFNGFNSCMVVIVDLQIDDFIYIVN